MSQIQATPQAARFTRSHKRPRFPTAHKPAPSLGGSGAGLLEACLFPQPKHDSDPHSWVTGEENSFSQLRKEFETDACIYGVRGLDAVYQIPCGSVWSCTAGRSSWGNSTICRGGVYS